MRPYAITDLHCDTLTEYSENQMLNSLNNNKMFSIDKLPDDIKWVQFFAIFIGDNCVSPKEYFFDHYTSFLHQVDKYADKLYFCRTYDDLTLAMKNSKCGGFLTIENGRVLEGKIENVSYLTELGIKALTLVWNGENEIGSGIERDKGLTDFGKAVIPELERQNIIIDVSHLNDNGFYDFLKIAKKPFWASHSNSRHICNHKRNLTDDMIFEIVKRDGIIGLNFHKDFVTDKESYTFEDVYLHIERLISLGAGKNIALGSDFDGGNIPECINSICKVENLYRYLVEKIPKKEVDAIFYKNAFRFIKNNMQK